MNSLRFNIAGAAAGWRAWDYTLPIPQVSVVVDEQRTSDPNGPNGILDVADIGTQVTQEYFSEQITDTDAVPHRRNLGRQQKTLWSSSAPVISVPKWSKTSSRASLRWVVGARIIPADIPAGLIAETCSGCEFDANLSNTTPAAGNALPTGSQAIPLGSVSFHRQLR